MSAQKPKPAQGTDGRFLSGNSGGGRPKGSRNKIGEDFLKAMADDFEEHGAAVIAKVRETKRSWRTSCRRGSARAPPRFSAS